MKIGDEVYIRGNVDEIRKDTVIICNDGGYFGTIESEIFSDIRMWIPVSYHEITEAERAENGYPKDWDVFIDCEMPSDEQEILVTTRYGTVEKDVCYMDGEFSLDSGYDWIDDILAWMQLPEPYKKREE